MQMLNKSFVILQPYCITLPYNSITKALPNHFVYENNITTMNITEEKRTIKG